MSLIENAGQATQDPEVSSASAAHPSPKLLSKEKLLAQVSPGLEADMGMKSQIQAQLQAEWQGISAKLSKLDAESNCRQANTKRIQLSADNSKADQRQKQTQLRAPVSGVIQQLAVHSVGGVVTSAQTLMVVVPDSNQVTAEVSIANQDIGFVNGGQGAEIKLETFSFTKYGTVKATVDNVSADAVTDEKKGSYYPATLTLEKKDMLIDGKHIAISPRMNVTAEIKTGKRRIIEFLLSPVQRAGSESLRER